MKTTLRERQHFSEVELTLGKTRLLDVSSLVECRMNGVDWNKIVSKMIWNHRSA